MEEEIINSPLSDEFIDNYIKQSFPFRIKTEAIMKGRGPQHRIRFNYGGVYLSFSLFHDEDGGSVNVVYGDRYTKIGWIYEGGDPISFAGLLLDFDFKTNEVIIYRN